MDLSSLVVGAIGMVAMVMAATDFVKRLMNLPAESRGVVTQLLVWAFSIGVIFLYSASEIFGAGVTIADVSVNNFDGASKVILGLAVGSAAMKGVDFLKAVDNSDSAKVPPL